MPENTETLDHKAEALRLADRFRSGFYKQDAAGAHVHALLAIAEGQERVADELKALRRSGLSGDEVKDALLGAIERLTYEFTLAAGRIGT